MRLLLVTPSRSYRTGDFLDAARAMGCEVTVAADVAPAVPGASVHVSFDDPAAAAERLVALVGDVDGVVGTDGSAVDVAAATARLLGLPTNSSDALLAAGNKHLQRLAAAAAGVSQPAFALIDRVDRLSWSTFPAVVKPLDRSASQGVIRVDSPVELDQAIRTVRQIVGHRSTLLVETFVAGTEVAVEGLLRGGRLEVLAVFDKPDTPQGPTFPETLLVSPARLEPGALNQVVDVVESAVASVGLMEGPVHVECKVDGTDVWFLELAARTIGGLCSRALDHGGVSLEELVIRHALRLPLPLLAAGGPATGVLMLPVTESGQVASVRGVDAARAVQRVTDVVMSVGSGQHVVALPAGDRYLGFVFARAQTADEVEGALRFAWASIVVEVTAS
ncbi:MAG: ATP-grasp domain-containing protein [Acidimicrobiales bacterium]